jgi:hypothetical protein
MYIYTYIHVYIYIYIPDILVAEEVVEEVVREGREVRFRYSSAIRRARKASEFFSSAPNSIYVYNVLIRIHIRAQLAYKLNNDSLL